MIEPLAACSLKNFSLAASLTADGPFTPNFLLSGIFKSLIALLFFNSSIPAFVACPFLDGVIIALPTFFGKSLPLVERKDAKEEPTNGILPNPLSALDPTAPAPFNKPPPTAPAPLNKPPPMPNPENVVTVAKTPVNTLKPLPKAVNSVVTSPNSFFTSFVPIPKVSTNVCIPNRAPIAPAPPIPPLLPFAYLGI